MSIHMHDLNIANNLDVSHNITAEHITASETMVAPSINAEELYVLNNDQAILTVGQDGVIANSDISTTGNITATNGAIQGSRLIANESITGTSMFLNQNIYFLHKPEGSTGWAPNFRIGYDSNSAILETLTPKGTLLLKSNNINIEGELLINGATPLHASNFNTYAPSLTGAGASGEWNISAYPRLSKLTSLPINSHSILLTSKTTESSAYYIDDLALDRVYDGQQYWHVLKLPDLCIGSSSNPSDCLSRKTINIAGTDINIWGGELSTEQLSTNLKKQGIVENSPDDEGKWVKIASKTINVGETSFITCHTRILEDSKAEGIFTAQFTGTSASLIWHSPSSEVNTDSFLIRTYLTADNTLAIGELYCQIGEFPQQYRVLMEDTDEQNNDPFWDLISFTSQDNLPSSNEGISIPVNYEDLTTNNEKIQHGIPNSIQANSIYLYNKNDSATLIKAHDSATDSLNFSLPPTSKEYTASTLLSSSYLVGEYDTIYGEVLPTNPEEGQVFFKINENGTKENETDRGYWITATPYIYRLKNA